MEKGQVIEDEMKSSYLHLFVNFLDSESKFRSREKASVLMSTSKVRFNFSKSA